MEDLRAAESFTLLRPGTAALRGLVNTPFKCTLRQVFAPVLAAVFLCSFVGAQTNLTATNQLQAHSNAINQEVARAQEIEKVRQACIENRRMICGKIIKIQSDGLVIDSGYTNLTRYPLNRSWLVPGTAVAARATNVIEGRQPDSICMGLVFLTDLPRSTGPKPKLYAFVNLEAFPMGQYTYSSVGDLQRTVRRFSCKLTKAVEWELQRENSQPQAHPSK